jgi:glycosyltransferase involved in cell wall biosynthesis
MYSLFIPVFNEEEILEENTLRVHDYASKFKLEHEVVIVSNGSDDGTVAIGERLAKEHKWLKFFSLEEKGPGLAFVKGVRESSGQWIITLDADLSSELTFIEFARDLLPHADMVAGSKTMGSQRRGVVRVIGSQTYILFTQILFNLTISDYSLGAKAYRRDSILPLLDNIDHWTGYVFEICAHIQGQGGKIIQVGIECDDTRVSRFNLFHEGFYRYKHLFNTFKKIRSSPNWLVE